MDYLFGVEVAGDAESEVEKEELPDEEIYGEGGEEEGVDDDEVVVSGVVDGLLDEGEEDGGGFGNEVVGELGDEEPEPGGQVGVYPGGVDDLIGDFA